MTKQKRVLVYGLVVLMLGGGMALTIVQTVAARSLGC